MRIENLRWLSINSMKKLLSIVSLIVLISCNRKSIPVITERNRDPSSRNEKTIAITEKLIADTAKGKIIFMNRCNRCHGLPDLFLFNSKRWENILEIMSPKAKLNAEQRIHIEAYVMANCAK